MLLLHYNYICIYSNYRFRLSRRIFTSYNFDYRHWSLYVSVHLIDSLLLTKECPVLDTRNGVYCIKSVSAIPLEESKARMELSNIVNKVDLFPAPSETSDLVSPESQPNDETFGQYNPHPTKVKFSDTEDVKVMTPLVDSQPTMHSETSSGVSTPTSEGDETSPIAKVIASRLSFWTRLSQRPTSQNHGKATLVNPENLKGEEDASLDNITEIIKLTSPPPTSTEERYNEMDDKILKECIKEFTKGVMFFAYNFGRNTNTPSFTVICPERLFFRYNDFTST